jgi:hypothetical protein
MNYIKSRNNEMLMQDITFKKKGALLVPTRPVSFSVTGKVSSPMYSKNSKMYLDIVLDNSEKVRDTHQKSSEYFKPKSKIIDPLVQTTLTVKVPWKYDRVMCSVLGLKTIRELVTGDTISATINFCGIWDVNNFCGPSWKLVNIMFQPL